MDTPVDVHGKMARALPFPFLFPLPICRVGFEFPTVEATINVVTRAKTMKTMHQPRRRRREAARASLINSSKASVFWVDSDRSSEVIVIAPPRTQC